MHTLSTYVPWHAPRAPLCTHKENTQSTGRQPPWWREAGISGTKQLYQPGPEPVIYIVPVTAILGRLALAPAGEHGTIPAFMLATPSAYPKGKCDEAGRPGTGSKLYYINSWAMSWPSDHPLPNKEDYT